MKDDDDTDVIIMDFYPDFEPEEPTRRLLTPTETMAVVQLTLPPGSVTENLFRGRTTTLTFGSRDSRLVLRVA